MDPPPPQQLWYCELGWDLWTHRGSFAIVVLNLNQTAFAKISDCIKCFHSTTFDFEQHWAGLETASMSTEQDFGGIVSMVGTLVKDPPRQLCYCGARCLVPLLSSKPVLPCQGSGQLATAQREAPNPKRWSQQWGRRTRPRTRAPTRTAPCGACPVSR